MPVPDRVQRGRRPESFDEVADLYATARPTYPKELVTDLIALTDLRKTHRVLEIGAGTGQLTVSLAEEGSVEAQINAFLAKYSPEVGAQLSAARSHLRALLPRGHELVYDNYNALVFGFSPTERTPDAFLSVAGYPRWVTLFFLRGVNLHDPNGLLQGSGSQVRSIRLRSAQQLMEPEVQALIAQAMLPHREALLRAAIADNR